MGKPFITNEFRAELLLGIAFSLAFFWLSNYSLILFFGVWGLCMLSLMTFGFASSTFKRANGVSIEMEASHPDIPEKPHEGP